MVIDEKGLLAEMRAAYKKKSTGYKVAARLSTKGVEEIVLSAPGWTAIISRENVPRKILGLIVEHVGDLPSVGEAFQVQDTKAQTEIMDMAVPELGKVVAGAAVKRTNLTYINYQIWQRKDNLNVFMLAPKLEDLLVNYNGDIQLTEDGLFFSEGVASKLYIQPLQVMQNDLPVLNHLAKMQWV